MSDSRQRILADIRRSLGREAPSADNLSKLESELDNPRPQVVPEAPEGLDGRLEQFVGLVTGRGVSVERVALSAVPQAVARRLEEHGLGTGIRRSSGAIFDALDWEGGGLSTSAGPAEDGDQAAVRLADAAIAESGTLVMVRSADSPATLSLVPRCHIVVVRDEDVLGTQEDVWKRLRATSGDSGFCRSLIFLTGVSSTMDIGFELVKPAHGPLFEHVIVAHSGSDR